MKSVLTDADYTKAATEIGCSVAAIKAVAQIEAPKGGFIDEYRMTILFERHHFSNFTNHQYDDHADISNRKAGGYLGGSREWDRFERAAELNLEAAKLSCSWGKFQIMGFNFGMVGFLSVTDMINDFNVSEQNQLFNGFVRFIFAKDLDDELRNKQWAAFARGYNGKNYKQFNYDTRIAEAYLKFGGK